MYTEEMLESIKKVEAKRAENAAMEPRRMTAEEKDQVLKENHPDYREDQFDVLTVGPNKGEKAPKELVKMQVHYHVKDIALKELSLPFITDYETFLRTDKHLKSCKLDGMDNIPFPSTVITVLFMPFPPLSAYAP